MVFASLHTIENDVSSIAAGGGTFTKLKSEPNPKKTTMNAARETSRPNYDPNDAQSLFKTLIRCVMRTFYDIPKSFVIEYIYYHDGIKHEELAKKLCLDPKELRAYIADFKRDSILIVSHRLEQQESGNGRRFNQDQYYYKIDMEKFINIVKYRLLNVRTQVETLERDQTCRQANYRCEGCGKEYTVLDIDKVFDSTRKSFVCTHCNEPVVEDTETKEDTNSQPRETVNVTLFNHQLIVLYEILEKIDELCRIEQQAKSAAEMDGFSTQNNNSNDAHGSRSVTTAIQQRSQASSMFDRTSQVKHDIEIVIEKEEDEYDTQMDIDETSNNESTISSSRGNVKVKKPAKPNTPGEQSANDNENSKSKSSGKKTAYEPKPMPIWFTLPAVQVDDNDNEQQLTHSTSQPQMNSSLARQFSNHRLAKATTVQDIRQMLLVNESRGKKPLVTVSMEDSMSPPTPNQIMKLKANSSLGANLQSKFYSGAAGSNTDDDDPSMSLFHTINEDSVHHMDMDT